CEEDLRAQESAMYEIPLERKGDRLPFQLHLLLLFLSSIFSCFFLFLAPSSLASS
ncbi:hypothetical protein NFI96_029405, partial [Prochilodus magdalenae]